MEPIDASIAPTLLAEIKYLYGVLGVFVAIFSVGGAAAMIKYGIKDNARRIVSLEGSRKGMYDKLAAQGESISGMEGRFDGIESQLKMIYQEVRNNRK